MFKNRKLYLIIFILFIISTSCSGKAGSKPDNFPSKGMDDMVDTRDEILQRITKDLPETIRTNILSDSDGFIAQLAQVLSLPEDTFLQADKQHSLDSEYEPEDIVSLIDYPELILSKDNLSLRKIIIPDLIHMVEDARKEGLTLVISSTYRTYDYQDRLFKWNVEQNGLETAERESARPGTSQHQLGTVIDFGTITDDYAFTPAGKWLLENAWKYGFSLSYPDGYEELTGYRYECWHFRYIGTEAAKLQKDYFGDIQHYLISFLNNNRDELESLF